MCFPNEFCAKTGQCLFSRRDFLGVRTSCCSCHCNQSCRCWVFADIFAICERIFMPKTPRKSGSCWLQKRAGLLVPALLCISCIRTILYSDAGQPRAKFEKRFLTRTRRKRFRNRLPRWMFVALFFIVCCGYMVSRMVKKLSTQQRKLRKRKFHFSFVLLIIAFISLTFLEISNLFEIAMILLLIAYWFMQVNMARLQHHHVVIRSLARGYDRVVGWIVFGPIMFVAMFLPFISAFQQRVMFNNAFTSGLEVSKLFSHDAAPAQMVKVKKTKKKKRDE